MLGKIMFEQNYQLIGINIDKEEGDKPSGHHILSLANKTAPLLDMNYQFTNKDLTFNSNYVGEGYGVIGETEKEAINLTAQTEGILLDPVYTGRAMGGLIDMIRSEEINKDSKVLFWHTGGAPALFAYSDSLSL